MAEEDVRSKEPTPVFVMLKKKAKPTSAVVEEEARPIESLNPTEEISTGQNAAVEQKTVDIVSF